MSGNYVEAWNDGGLESIAHLDGVDWYDAAAPRRWHKCWAQTIGFVNHERVARCACGAIRLGADPTWTRRNTAGNRSRFRSERKR